MATDGPNQGTSAAEVDVFETAWTNPGNAVADNDSFATVALSDTEAVYSNYLDITGFNFARYAGDTITHVQVEVACKESAGDNVWSAAQLLKAGSPVGSEQSPAGDVQSTETWLSLNSPVGSWGTTLTGTEVNNSGFGVRIRFQAASGSGTVSVDVVRITLTYTPGPPTWNAEVRDKEVVSAVVRTSDTVVTITLSAAPDYDITAQETITVTVPGAALTGASPLTGSPTFTVDPVAAGGCPKQMMHQARLRRAS